MKLILLVALAVLLILSVHWFLAYKHHQAIGRGLVERAVAYQDLSQDYGTSLLVLGDSTGVGVGAATSSDSVAALLAHGMQATYTENVAVSGSEVKDLPGQLAHAQLARYDTILVQIGANDVVAFHGAEQTAARLAPILATLAARGSRVLLMSAGNVGSAPAIPPPLRPFYTWLNLRYHVAFAKVAAAQAATYINLYMPREEDPFSQRPDIYLAADQFHPSSLGYALWYQRLTEVVTP